MGSNNAVKNTPVDMVAKATETLETFMALKKVTQCKAIVIPAITMVNKVFFDTLMEYFFKPINFST